MILFILNLHVAWWIPSSLCSIEYMGWKRLFEKFLEGCLVHDHLLYQSGKNEAFRSLFLAWPIQSSFCSWGHIVCRKMLFEAFRDGYLVDSHLWYLNGMIEAILDLHFALKTPINFLLKRKYRLEDVVWRIPRWLFSPWLSMIFMGKDFSYSESQEGIKFWRCCLKNSIKAVKCMAIFGIRVQWFKHLAYLADDYHQVFAQEDISSGRCCLKNFKMAV